MDHRGDATYLELLEALGVGEEPAYRLLCGAQAAPSPHRHMVDAIEGAPTSPPHVVPLPTFRRLSSHS